jgi:predicted nuclease of restriction endonuclease-like RecB superfamily
VPVFLPETLLSFSTAREGIVPHFLGEHDHPWLRVLIEESERFAGRRRADLEEHLRGPLACSFPEPKRRLAAHVLRRSLRDRRGGVVPPLRAREVLFAAAAQSGEERSVVLAAAARKLGVTADALEESLFADLPGERLVVAPRQWPSPQELALRANQAIAQTLLARSLRVRVELEGGARPVVRHAKLRGLICTVEAREHSTPCAIEISGPLALFRRTIVYGRALAELLPLLAWCRRFHLHADCVLRGREIPVRLGSGDPIIPSPEPRAYDSRLEERFARDFRRIAPGWVVVREPEPVRAGDRLVFPDFALERRTDGRRWLLEIVGFWTSDYLAKKLASYRAASLPNLILCVDEARRCEVAEHLPEYAASVVFFRRRIDPASVLALVEAREAAPARPTPRRTGVRTA